AGGWTERDEANGGRNKIHYIASQKSGQGESNRDPLPCRTSSNHDRQRRRNVSFGECLREPVQQRVGPNPVQYPQRRRCLLGRFERKFGSPPIRGGQF